MMKKILKNLTILSMMALIFIPTINIEAETLGSFKRKVSELERKKHENDVQSNAVINKVSNMRNEITSFNQTITDNKNKVEESKNLVAASEEKIKTKTNELKDLIQVLQYSKINKDEAYIDYIFDATSVAEMIERKAVVEQIIQNTQEQLTKLKELIENNKQLQNKLAEDNENLTNSISKYEEEVEKLQEEISNLANTGLDYNSKIQAQKGLIRMYEKAGCKDNEEIDICYYGKVDGNGAFSRPVNRGRITQPWRVASNGKILHAGIDIGGVAPGTPIYAPANGTIVYTKHKWRCGGNIIYMHAVVNGRKYTIEFAHLKSIKVNIGDVVRKGQIIATLGGDSSTWYYDKCTTGAHLHYAIADGYYFTDASWNGFYSFQSKTRPTSKQSISGFKNQRGWTWQTRG